MKLNKILSLAVLVALCATTLTSCVKKDVDDPPANGLDPGLTANRTIAQIKGLFVSGAVTKITGDFIFKAVVVADDRSGNLYKSIVLQDSTGGINIVVDMSNFYTSYETGRNVFVKCKGLYIGDYNGLIQLGGYDDAGQVGRIPSSLVGQHLIGGMWNQSYKTKVVYHMDNTELNNTADQNTLVRLSGVHFANPCNTWADVPNQQSGNEDLIDAYGNVIVVRTSNYSNFATKKIPGATGDVIGVFQIYGSTKQLVIRDLNDVLMAPASCAPPTGPTITMAGLRALFTGSNTTIPANTIVQGVVISDKSTVTTNALNVVLQDATGGILVRWTASNTYNLGDEIVIDVSGQQLSLYNTLLQVNGCPNNKSALLHTGVTVTPRIATVADIIANRPAWESTLLKVLNVTSLTGGTGGTYQGNVNLNDGSGTLILYTPSGATFKTSAYPSTAASITGYLNVYNSIPELQIRSTGDVQ